MHDFFLSYASVERARADRVHAQLRGAGRSVWIDEADPQDREQVVAGIPAGQAHRTTIEEAIERSSAFLVLYSAVWATRPYCLDELAHAVAVGKRVILSTSSAEPDDGQPAAFLSTADADLVAALGSLDAGQDIAEAQTRLLADMSDTVDGGWRAVLRNDAARARDAELLAHADRASFGVGMNEELVQYCAGVQEAARRFRRTIAAALSVLLVVTATLTVWAAVGRQAAVESRERSASAAAHARSLLLAQQALGTTSTAQALETARSALRTESNLSTRSTLSRLEATARYRQILQIEPGSSLAAAVSDDGGTALVVRPDTVTILGMASGSVDVIPIARQLGGRAALSADGRTGYVVDREARLLCVETGRRSVVAAAVGPVVDIKVQPDGSTWWMSPDGDLYHTQGCPAAQSEALLHTEPALAFELTPDSNRVFVLTRDAAVSTYDLPADPDGARLGPISRVSLVAASAVGGSTHVVGSAGWGQSSVTRCGDRMHVLASVVAGRTALPKSAHVTISRNGTASSDVTVDLLMAGVGCGPVDDAWAVPALNIRPRQLPAGGHYPSGIVDQRDKPAQVVLGNSVGRTSEVLGHPDGRIEVLVRNALPWGTFGDREITVPLADAQVEVTQSGQIVWRDAAGTGKPIGDLGGPPGPDAVGARHRAYLTTGSMVVEVADGRVVRTLDMPGPIQSLTASPSGDVVVGGDIWWRQLTADAAPRVLLPPSNLGVGERVLFMHADGDRVLQTTNHGGVLVADPLGRVLAKVQAPVAGPTSAAFRADHSVVAITADGILRSYSPDLRPLRSTVLGSGGIRLTMAAGGSAMVVALADFSVWVLDPATLEQRQRIAIESPDVRRIWLSPDGTFLQRTFPAPSGTAVAAETIPLSD